MHEFRVIVGEQALLVALEVFQAVEGDAAEGIDRGLLGADGSRAGLEGAERRVQEEVVAALGLAGNGRVQVMVAPAVGGSARRCRRPCRRVVPVRFEQ